jgi:hypothetical protein
MNVAVHVCFRMVNHLMRVFLGKPIVGLQRVTVERGLGLDVLTYQRLQFVLAARFYYLGAYLSATLQDGGYNRLALTPCAGDFLGAFISVHVASLLPDEGLVNLDFPESFPPVCSSCIARRIRWSINQAVF